MASGLQDNKPFILALTTVPSHMDSLVIFTMTKAGFVTEDDVLPFNSMTVSHDTIAVIGDVDVVLSSFIIKICVHDVLRHAAVYQWHWH